MDSEKADQMENIMILLQMFEGVEVGIEIMHENTKQHVFKCPSGEALGIKIKLTNES